jgi:very-short-patch-repair endonuclease
VQVRLRGGARRAIARVDLFWDDARLVVELDGHRTHSTRRDRQRGAERACRLGLAGWRVVTFTYEDVVERPDHVADMIRRHLDLAA